MFCPRFQHFVHYSPTVKTFLQGKLHFQEVRTLQLSVFFVHDQLHYVSRPWSLSRRLWVHAYIILIVVQLKDVISLFREDTQKSGTVPHYRYCTAAREVKRDRADGDQVNTEMAKDVPDLGRYFITSELQVQ